MSQDLQPRQDPWADPNSEITAEPNITKQDLEDIHFRPRLKRSSTLSSEEGERAWSALKSLYSVSEDEEPGEPDTKDKDAKPGEPDPLHKDAKRGEPDTKRAKH